MKTIADAHRALNGDLKMIRDFHENDEYLFFWSSNSKYASRNDRHGHHAGMQYICTVEEFNNYKGESVKPVYTNQMRDDDVLPEIGLNCLLSESRNGHDGYSAFVAGNNAGEQVYITAHFETRTGLKMAAYFSNNENKRFGGVACAIAFAPIDTRTDKEKAIDDLFKLDESICNNINWHENFLDKIIEGKVHGVKWVGK